MPGYNNLWSRRENIGGGVADKNVEFYVLFMIAT